MIGLTYVRNLYNLSMDDLAKKLNVSKQTISKWENGKIPIAEERIKQLKGLFNLEDDYFTYELNEIEISHLQIDKVNKELDNINMDSEQHKNKKNQVLELVHKNILLNVLDSVKRNIESCNDDSLLHLYMGFNNMILYDKVDIKILKAIFKTIEILYKMDEESIVPNDPFGGEQEYEQSLVEELIIVLSKYKS